jgi:hypothetical protein
MTNKLVTWNDFLPNSYERQAYGILIKLDMGIMTLGVEYLCSS